MKSRLAAISLGCKQPKTHPRVGTKKPGQSSDVNSLIRRGTKTRAGQLTTFNHTACLLQTPRAPSPNKMNLQSEKTQNTHNVTWAGKYNEHSRSFPSPEISFLLTFPFIERTYRASGFRARDHHHVNEEQRAGAF